MRIRALLVAALLAMSPLSAHAATIIDPALRWHTLETPHFRVNYVEGYEAIAQRAAHFAEEAHAKLAPVMKREPTMRTELVLLDSQDTTNGFAFPYPNNQIQIYLTPPDQDLLWGKYDSWLKHLITHEYTHILHLETTDGISEWVNRLLGRALYPNLTVPNFLIEGLAVHMETEFTTGGRGREGDFDMILRCLALDDQLADIDQAAAPYLGGGPGSNGAYLYGTYFYRYLIETYGADVPTRIAHQYAALPILDINLAIHQVLPGKNAFVLWDELKVYLKQRAAKQLAGIQRHPLTESRAVTTSGGYHRHPRWLPDGRLLYPEFVRGEYSVLLMDALDGTPPRRMIYKSPFGSYQVSADGKEVHFAAYRDSDRFNSGYDLYKFDVASRKVERLTDGMRVKDPAVSPDGKQILAVVNGKARNDLARFDAQGKLIERLSEGTDGQQISGLAWSPDGTQVAASLWKDGSRDLYLIDPATGAMRPLWRDLAVETAPAWSPDGQWLLFSSDHTGVFNLHALRLSDGKAFQVTNVVGGALEPSVSPDGKQIAFSLYTSGGYDIHVMPFEPASWRPVVGPAQAFGSDGTLSALPLPQGETMPLESTPFPSQPYSPWPTLRPKVWSPIGDYGPHGLWLGGATYGMDVLLKHYLYLSAGAELNSRRPFYSLFYQNDELPPSVTVSLSDLPSLYGVGQTLERRIRMVQGDLGVTFPGMPSQALGHLSVMGDSLTLGYRYRAVSGLAVLDRRSGQPVSDPQGLEARERASLERALAVTPEGMTHSVYAQWRHADNYRPSFAISPERGNLGSLTYELAPPGIGGQAGFNRLSGDYRSYHALPWKRHVLGWRVAGGANFGRPGGDYSLGGSFSTLPSIYTDLRYVGDVSAVPLRGYGYGILQGSTLLAGSLEYRFPIFELHRGLWTLPLFLDTLHAAAFYDVGLAGSRDELSLARVKHGLGLEARAKIFLNQIPTEVRLGVAQGTSPGGGTQVYTTYGVSF
ncbi:translocation protein TolB [compost metagenome]